MSNSHGMSLTAMFNYAPLPIPCSGTKSVSRYVPSVHFQHNQLLFLVRCVPDARWTTCELRSRFSASILKSACPRGGFLSPLVPPEGDVACVQREPCSVRPSQSRFISLPLRLVVAVWIYGGGWDGKVILVPYRSVDAVHVGRLS